MPSWFIHLSTANDVTKKIKVDKNEYLFANLMPDFNSGYVIKSNCIVDYSITHKGKYEKGILPDIEKFKQEYKDKMNNTVILGYWSHLLTDYFWNKLVYEKYCVYDDKNEKIGYKRKDKTIQYCSKEEIRKTKVNDFHVFEKYLLSRNEIQIPYFTNDILEKSKEIKEIYVQKKEMLNAIDYLNIEKEKSKIEEEQYNMFSQEDIQKYYEQSIEFILEEIKK